MFGVEVHVKVVGRLISYFGPTFMYLCPIIPLPSTYTLYIGYGYILIIYVQYNVPFDWLIIDYTILF